MTKSGNTPLNPRILVTCKILVERGIAYPFVLLHRINVYQVVENRIDGEAGDSLDAGLAGNVLTMSDDA